jgi:hypothetical protein
MALDDRATAKPSALDQVRPPEGRLLHAAILDDSVTHPVVWICQAVEMDGEARVPAVPPDSGQGSRAASKARGWAAPCGVPGSRQCAHRRTATARTGERQRIRSAPDRPWPASMAQEGESAIRHPDGPGASKR